MVMIFFIPYYSVLSHVFIRNLPFHRYRLHSADEKRGNCFIIKVLTVLLIKMGFVEFLVSLAHPMLPHLVYLFNPWKMGQRREK